MSKFSKTYFSAFSWFPHSGTYFGPCSFALSISSLVPFDLDLYQNIIWSRWNIEENNKFIIPWLTKYMQKFIWWENKLPLKWGVTRWRKEIWENDINAAKEKMNVVLMWQAKEKINNYIREYNLTNKTIKLFPIEDFIIKEVVQMTVPKDILWKQQDYFNIHWKMLVKAYVFYENYFHQFLKNEFKNKEDPNMNIETILFNQMLFRKYDETPIEVRVTCSLQWRQSYDINLDSQNGKIFQIKLKEHIKWLKKHEAQNYIQNKQEINNVKITIFPNIKKHLPMVKENIKIIID